MMATCWEDIPYISLMNFTYLEAENKVLLSTRRDSKKYDNIQKNKHISLLVYSSVDGVSATLLGTALTIEAAEEAHYKAIHLQKNDMPQFILGENIGLIVFEIEKIVVSNSKDEVKYINDIV
jgi:nitroimidazol reductase NimA-like FMN-containing flavoprotein (pyridoxamine 5'-phosphate oxidase superfamily)